MTESDPYWALSPDDDPYPVCERLRTTGPARSADRVHRAGGQVAELAPAGADRPDG